MHCTMTCGSAVLIGWQFENAATVACFGGLACWNCVACRRRPQMRPGY